MSYPESVQYVCSTEPFKVHIETRELGELQADEVVIKSEYSASKLGTELAVLSGKASFINKEYDHEQKIMKERDNVEFVARPGNTTIGEIVAIGSDVIDFKEGDRVFAHGGFQEYHRMPASRVRSFQNGLTDDAALCLDPADVALGTVRDCHVRLGDAIVIFGQGAIGLFAAQMARLQGAGMVIVVDPQRSRRELSLKQGAHIGLDPSDTDIGVEVRKILGRPGADVIIETSSNYRALQAAIRSVAYGGTVCVVSYYTGEAQGLFLGEEWHFNQINMISSRTDSLPPRDHPRWDRKRLHDATLNLLASGKLDTTGLIDPIVKFNDAPAAYLDLMKDPGKGIKLGVRYE